MRGSFFRIGRLALPGANGSRGEGDHMVCATALSLSPLAGRGPG